MLPIHQRVSVMKNSNLALPLGWEMEEFLHYTLINEVTAEILEL